MDIKGSEIVGRIDSRRGALGFSRQDVAVAGGLRSSQSLTDWGKGRIPSADTAVRIADYLGVPIRWLITGEDEDGFSLPERNLVVKFRCLTAQGRFEVNALMDAKLTVANETPVPSIVKEEPPAVIDPPKPADSMEGGKPMPNAAIAYETEFMVGEPPPPPYLAAAPARSGQVIDISRHTGGGRKDGVRFTGWDVIMLPHMGRVAAGVPIEINEVSSEWAPFPQPLLRGSDREYFFVTVSGTSMTEAGINDGDLVLLRKARAPRQGKIMLVRHENESTLKRVKMKENGEVFLHWEDGSGRSQRVDDPDWEVQGELFTVMHDIK